MGKQSVPECNQFREQGGKPGAPDDPALKWASEFWRYREQHPGTPAATYATRMALTWLRHADQDQEVIARSDKLAADDPVWERQIGGMRDSARKTGAWARFRNKADEVLRASKPGPLRTAVRMALARSWLDQGNTEEAKTAFRALIEEDPGSEAALTARRQLDALLNLQVGQPAPQFEAKALDGRVVSLKNLEGKVVWLNFWASW